MGTLKPDGGPSVIPRIITMDVVGLVAFLTAVFDADGEFQLGW